MKDRSNPSIVPTIITMILQIQEKPKGEHKCLASAKKRKKIQDGFHGT